MNHSRPPFPEPPSGPGPGIIAVFVLAGIILALGGAIGWTFGALAGSRHALTLCYQEAPQ
jgi:hypothetical protein